IIQIKRRSGCNKVVLPNGETAKPKVWNTKATPLQLALAHGYGATKTVTVTSSRMVLSELAIYTPLSWKISCRGLRMPAASVNVTARNPEAMLSLGIVNLNILTGFLYTPINMHAKWRAPMKSLMRA
ncbi:MAG: hypothetical protein PHR94_01095, partial [Methylomonas lenta]|nr:hypothetical protein [Methylomonas lenta]